MILRITGVDIIDLDSVGEETVNSMLKIFLGDSNEQSEWKIGSIMESFEEFFICNHDQFTP